MSVTLGAGGDRLRRDSLQPSTTGNKAQPSSNMIRKSIRSINIRPMEENTGIDDEHRRWDRQGYNDCDQCGMMNLHRILVLGGDVGMCIVDMLFFEFGL